VNEDAGDGEDEGGGETGQPLGQADRDVETTESCLRVGDDDEGVKLVGHLSSECAPRAYTTPTKGRATLRPQETRKNPRTLPRAIRVVNGFLQKVGEKWILL
jgi:hypothetical protein